MTDAELDTAAHQFISADARGRLLTLRSMDSEMATAMMTRGAQIGYNPARRALGMPVVTRDFGDRLSDERPASESDVDGLIGPQLRSERQQFFDAFDRDEWGVIIARWPEAIPALPA